jgi:hypothetical protein
MNAITHTIKHTLLHIEPEHQLLTVTWTRPVMNQDYRELWDAILPIAHQHRVVRWLLDQRQMGAMMPADMQWVVEDWYPRSVKLLGNSRRSAILVSANVFGELTVKKGISSLVQTQDLETAYFTELEEARRWLLNS